MRPFFSFFSAIRVLAAVVFLTGPIVKSPAQNGPSVGAPQGGVVLTKLANPLYPPLARQTRITGDVELVLEVRNDGAVQSVNVVKGHPLLRQAALDSAQQSLFECRRCGEATVSYSVVYTFQLIGSEGCCKADEAKQDQPLPRVTQSDNHVTVIDQPVCICDPAADLRKARSVKCLYLWKCGVR